MASLDRIGRGAGGAVSDLVGAPLRYNRAVPRFASGLIAAADPAPHHQLLRALRAPAPGRPGAAPGPGDPTDAPRG